MPTYAANVERDPSLLLFDGASLSRWKQSDDRWAEKGNVRYDLGRLVNHLQVGAKWMRSSLSYDSTRVAEWDFPGTPLDGTLLAASGLIQKDVPTILHGEYYYGAVMSRQTVISAITDSGTARGTIREALFQREPAGLIYRRDRSGWYVSPPAITYDPTRWTGFMACVIEQHRIPRPKCCRSKAWRRRPGWRTSSGSRRHAVASCHPPPLGRRSGGPNRANRRGSRPRAGAGAARSRLVTHRHSRH
ncbi:hypothetical protein [Sphingomonas endophytica]|uniref:hypothetical protein n=1 Tax=Sphingomonas endophytica TaxID=869719 RepID=UPI00073711A1|nr:hypothetical protein [Sphingomonas endophytica]